MAFKPITSKDNPVYREWLKLATDKRARKQSRRTLAEGHHLAQAALEAGISPLGWMVSETAMAEARDLSVLEQVRSRVPAWVVPDKLFKTLSPSTTPAGLLAMLPQPEPSLVKSDFSVLLEDIQDPGNLGALMRVAAAAGVGDVYLSSGCAEAWSPKCLRGGQGAHFLVSIQEDADLVTLAQTGPGPCYGAVLGAEASLFDLNLTGHCVFAFGNEGAGLSTALRAACRPFSIPMLGRVESLNVATAAAVCLFERVRQRSGK